MTTSKKDKGQKVRQFEWSNFGWYSRELWPYVWPYGNRWLQFQAALCLLIIVLNRLVNIFVPIYYKKISK